MQNTTPFEQDFVDVETSANTMFYANSRDHGFWEDILEIRAVLTENAPALVKRFDTMVIAEKIALIHSELSEALEAVRHNNPPDSHIPAFSGLEAELADARIRIGDLANYEGLRLGTAILAKHEYNRTRPYKHGKVS